jgi:hypothetical protein
MYWFANTSENVKPGGLVPSMDGVYDANMTDLIAILLGTATPSSIPQQRASAAGKLALEERELGSPP